MNRLLSSFLNRKKKEFFEKGQNLKYVFYTSHAPPNGNFCGRLTLFGRLRVDNPIDSSHAPTALARSRAATNQQESFPIALHH